MGFYGHFFLGPDINEEMHATISEDALVLDDNEEEYELNPLSAFAAFVKKWGFENYGG
jgi:hypothetical protein